VYLICANRWGEERDVRFNGNSCIINPDGSILNTQAEGDSIVYGDVDITAPRNKAFAADGYGDKILDRVPDSYHILSLNPYIHNPTRFFSLNKYRSLPQGQRSLIATISMNRTSRTP